MRVGAKLTSALVALRLSARYGQSNSKLAIILHTARHERSPKPAYFTFGTFVVSAPSSDYRVAELVAEDSNGRVTPEIGNLNEGQVIGEGQTVQFELRTPPTNGQQSNLRFYISFEGANGKACNDCIFN